MNDEQKEKLKKFLIDHKIYKEPPFLNSCGTILLKLTKEKLKKINDVFPCQLLRFCRLNKIGFIYNEYYKEIELN